MLKVNRILIVELADEFFKQYEERELRREENKQFIETKNSSSFSQSTKKESEIIIDAIERAINNNFKKVFNVTDEDLQRNDFKEARNLRIAKLIKKLRMQIISGNMMEYLKNTEQEVNLNLK